MPGGRHDGWARDGRAPCGTELYSVARAPPAWGSLGGVGAGGGRPPPRRRNATARPWMAGLAAWSSHSRYDGPGVTCCRGRAAGGEPPVWHAPTGRASTLPLAPRASGPPAWPRPACSRERSAFACLARWHGPPRRTDACSSCLHPAGASPHPSGALSTARWRWPVPWSARRVSPCERARSLRARTHPPPSRGSFLPEDLSWLASPSPCWALVSGPPFDGKQWASPGEVTTAG
jgi:hypothetical protein